MTAAHAHRPPGSAALPRRPHGSSPNSVTLSPGDFELLAREYTPRLLVVARRLLRSEDDASDAVQDAMLSAYASRHTFHGHSTVYTWLYRIVVNACLMKIRASRRWTPVSLSDLSPAPDGRGFGRYAVAVCTKRIDGGSELDREETREVVRACIDELPDAFRTIVLLRDIEGFDTERTAGLLGLSRVAAKTRLHRARQMLRTVLKAALTGV